MTSNPIIEIFESFYLALSFPHGELLLVYFKKGNKGYSLKKKDSKDLELPISKLKFIEIDGKLNLLIGTSLGYLIFYDDIEKNLLNHHIVVNNSYLEESILDFVVYDFDSDGTLEVLVFYFNRVVQFFRLNKNIFEFLGK